MKNIELYEDFLTKFGNFLNYVKGKKVGGYSSGYSSNTPDTGTSTTVTPREVTNIARTMDDSRSIVVSGSYTLPSNIPNKGDALHAFNRRRSDKWGGYILAGPNNPDMSIPDKFKSYIKFDQGMGINDAMEKMKKQGLKPDIKEGDLQINVVNSSKVEWQAVISPSPDSNSWTGVATVGSAGGGADRRATGQIEGMKKKRPEARDWTLILDLNISTPMKIRQFFYKYK